VKKALLCQLISSILIILSDILILLLVRKNFEWQKIFLWFYIKIYCADLVCIKGGYMRILPISQKFIHYSYFAKTGNKAKLYSTVAGFMLPGVAITKIYCGDEEDNSDIRSGESPEDTRRRQEREQERERNNRLYYGYDTPGLGSGSREVDWS